MSHVEAMDVEGHLSGLLLITKVKACLIHLEYEMEGTEIGAIDVLDLKCGETRQHGVKTVSQNVTETKMPFYPLSCRPEALISPEKRSTGRVDGPCVAEQSETSN